MYPKARLFTLVAGAAALAGLTYGFGRLALRPRPRSMVTAAAQRVPADALPARAPEAWESALIAQSSPSDALDLALNLDGTFDAAADETSGVTVRPSEHVPHPSSSDDEDPPSPDDLGRAWLAHATQSEHSFTEADLAAELDELAVQDEPSEADEEAATEDGERPSYA